MLAEAASKLPVPDKVPLKDPFYVGIGLSAHNKDATETAIFRGVELTPAPAAIRRAKGWHASPRTSWRGARIW